MARGDINVICLNKANDDWGMYITYYFNPQTGTSLYFRGTKAEVDEWFEERERRRKEREASYWERRAQRSDVVADDDTRADDDF